MTPLPVPVFAVLWKVVELRAGVDPLTGEVQPDPASLGVSAADEAALEWGLRCAERFRGVVRLVSAGGPEIDGVLLQARAAGASEVIRVDPVAAGAEPGLLGGSGGSPCRGSASSEAVATALAPFVADASLVWCGDVSPDRGSGAVPAYVAEELGIAQALGLVRIELLDSATGPGSKGDPDADPASAPAFAPAPAPVPAPRLELLRRLDGGRRERLLVTGRAVLSCEGGTARLRRASLPAVLAARDEGVEVRPGPVGAHGAAGVAVPVGGSAARVVSVAPYRPRTQVVPPPSGTSAIARIQELTRVGEAGRTARAVTVPPEKAADLILEALSAWGERP
jgi:electron transfer flavoprotein beta subunit